MDTKLTLKLDKSVIESAKKYAVIRQKSLSKLVEEFFKNLTQETGSTTEYPSFIEDLSGIISEQELDYISKEDERVQYILRQER
ncbi:MAG: DUF6364 family protein [Treponema sp.]|nr:DUF6364 family protein [Treponema sp.]